MRFSLCLMLGFFLFESRALAQDFNSELKDAEPTIEFTSPVIGQTVSPFNLDIRWKTIGIRRGNLGMVLEHVETGKRTFIGDGNSLERHAFSDFIIPLNYEYGRYKMIGYHYGQDTRNYTYAGVGPEFIIAPDAATFWTKWNEPEKLCPRFSGTKNYRIEDIKKVTCNEETCEGPKIYWNSTYHALLSNHPLHLPADKYIIKVTCLPSNIGISETP